MGISQRKHPVGQPVQVAQPVDPGGQLVAAVKIAAQRDGLLPIQAEEAFDVVDRVVDHRIALPHEEGRIQVDADEPLSPRDFRKLPVGQVARVAAQGARIAVRRDKRPVDRLTHIQKPLSDKCDTSTMMPFSAQSRTSCLPASVNPSS